MKPAILQKDELNRVAFDPEAQGPHDEIFFLHLTDPKHPRALGIRLRLNVEKQKARVAEVQAVYAGDGKPPQLAQERWPMSRIHIDPERAGIGIGESNVAHNASHGLVHGDDFALAWDLSMVDESKGYEMLPASWLYRRGGVTPKITTPHPGSRVQAGRLEIWHGLSRHAPVTRIDLSGWQGMQGHRWGSAPSQHYAWVHCNAFKHAPTGSFFEAFAGPIKLGRLWEPHALLARLKLGTQTYNFNTWRNLFAQPSRFSPTAWSFAVQGPQGSLTATVQANPSSTVAGHLQAAPGKIGHFFGNHLACLQLDLQPADGPARSLMSERAAFEVGQPEPSGAVQSAA